MKPNRSRDRGAAAVEFALLLPMLLFIVFVLADLGWVFNQQLAVTSASREAVRYYTVHHSDTDPVAEAAARATAETRAKDLIPEPTTVTFAWTACSNVPGAEASVVVKKPITDLTGLVVALAGSTKLSATGTMRCGG
ncbi:TadE family protein [Agromyces sp. CCNWLW203]|uniref:TadE family protein n=1 Tax=Agromyces sp. CCNWLW203 TaxID=3112842 RepID=UPI002F96C9D8